MTRAELVASSGLPDNLPASYRDLSVRTVSIATSRYQSLSPKALHRVLLLDAMNRYAQNSMVGRKNSYNEMCSVATSPEEQGDAKITARPVSAEFRPCVWVVERWNGATEYVNDSIVVLFQFYHDNDLQRNPNCYFDEPAPSIRSLISMLTDTPVGLRHICSAHVQYSSEARGTLATIKPFVDSISIDNLFSLSSWGEIEAELSKIHQRIFRFLDNTSRRLILLRTAVNVLTVNAVAKLGGVAYVQGKYVGGHGVSSAISIDGQTCLLTAKIDLSDKVLKSCQLYRGAAWQSE